MMSVWGGFSNPPSPGGGGLENPPHIKRNQPMTTKGLATPSSVLNDVIARIVY